MDEMARYEKIWPSGYNRSAMARNEKNWQQYLKNGYNELH
jgi:hypothetical protein